ncbi:MAG: stage II sporulation protein M, partial [Candidatus Caldarchaeum sp.]
AVSRFLSALAATAVLIILLAAGALTPIPVPDAQSMVEGFEELVASLTASPAGIFFNNLVASLLMIIPALGMALAAFIVYNTGLVIGAVSITSNIPVGLSLLIPFLTLYGFVEMLAYGFAVSESFFLTSAVVRRRFRSEVRVVPYVLVVVVVLLGVAAVIEWLLIEFFQTFLPS